MDFKELIEILRSTNYLLIAAHKSPDGDAIGAMVGLGQICKNLGISYTILMEEIPLKYKYLTDTVTISDSFTGHYDVFISVDCGDIERLGRYEEYLKKAPITVNIDHHITNTQFGTYNFVDVNGSSTSELIFDLVMQLELPLNVDLAKAIYTGIVTDTGGFMHSCTNPSTHQAAAKLIEQPFDASMLYHQLIHAKTFKTMQLEKVAMEHLIPLANNKIFISYFKEQDLIDYEATKNDLDGMISSIKNIEGTQIAALIYPTGEKGAYKISLRSNSPYDVATIASCWGGGGHIRAAGATTFFTLEEILDKLKKQLLQTVVE